MKFDLVYTTPLEPPVAQARAGEYLAKSGYSHEMGSSTYLRGFKYGSRYMWGIKRWAALASVKAESGPQGGNALNLALDVDTRGQWITGREKKLWEKELVELGQVVQAKNTQGTVTPWPGTIYWGFVTTALAVLGALIGGYWGYTLAHSIAITILVAFLGLGVLAGLGQRYERAQAKKKAPLLPDVLPRQPGAVLPGTKSTTDPTVVQSEITALEWNMRKEIRSWALWCGILGVVNLATNGLSSAWGATLLLVAVASLVFQAPAMFVLYGITLAWVAINNLAGGNTQWIIFALMQFYFSFRVFANFRRFRPVLDLYQPQEGGLPAPQPQPVLKRAGAIFPWLGAVLSGSAVLGFLVIFVIMIFFSHSQAYGTYKTGLYFLIDFFVDLAMLGLALGVGSLLSRYRFKAVSIAAVVLGGLLMITMLILMVLG